MEELFKALHHESAKVRLEASQRLWENWFSQMGAQPRERLILGSAYIEQRRFSEAEEEFSHLIQHYPNFAEAYNKRATVYYLQAKYEWALTDCQQVIELNPRHFGAWHGMGLCYFTLEQYNEAITSFRRALAIQPHAQVNQKMILECLTHIT